MDREPTPKISSSCRDQNSESLNTCSRALSSSLSCLTCGLCYDHRHIIKQTQSIFDFRNIPHRVELEQAIVQIGGRRGVHVQRKKEKYGANIKHKMCLLVTFFLKNAKCLCLEMSKFYQLINQKEKFLNLTDVKVELFSRHAGHT